ncbi:MAG: HEPN domain-containing protein [Gemmatimonadales bacterium]
MGSPLDWLRRARSNLVLARQPKPPEALWEDLCFEAQQAAEKAIKAVLVSRGVDFPKTHDLGRLLRILEESGMKLPAPVWRSPELTAYAWEARYPGDYEPATADVHRRAVELAEAVVRWAGEVVHAV